MESNTGQLDQVGPSPRTVSGVIARGAERWPTRTAIVLDDHQVTYGELCSRAHKMLRALGTAGLSKGDRLLVMLDNSLEFLDAFLACGIGGIVQVPINTEYRGILLRDIIERSGARVFLVGADYVSRLESLGPIPALKCVIIVDGRPPDIDTELPMRSLSALLLPEQQTAFTVPTVAEHDPIAVMFTSGTTGPSKGVLIAHRHAYEYARGAGLVEELCEGDRYYAPLPMYHVGGQWATIYAAFIFGATAVVKRHFSVRDFWTDVHRHQVTVSFLLGAMAQYLYNQPGAEADINNNLERILMVPLVADLDGFRRRFGVRVCTCYASTEANLPIAADFGISDPSVAGRAISGYQVRLVDENDNEVSDGAVGELVLRPPEPWMTMIEYISDPESTSHALRNLWLHSGDMFRRDGDGTFRFVDRVKDAIRRRGENISSFEIEREVFAHPGVAECAAFAMPSRYTEDDLGVCVVLKAGHRLSKDDLRTFLAGRVPKFMIPDEVWVIDEMPKTATGKIEKHVLRQRFVAVAKSER